MTTLSNTELVAVLRPPLSSFVPDEQVLHMSFPDALRRQKEEKIKNEEAQTVRNLFMAIAKEKDPEARKNIKEKLYTLRSDFADSIYQIVNLSKRIFSVKKIPEQEFLREAIKEVNEDIAKYNKRNFLTRLLPFLQLPQLRASL